MMNSIYKVLTPAGQFDAIFAEDEDIPIEYSGDELAIGFFKDWLFINQISGEHGHLLDSLKLTPNDLCGFCHPLDSGIEIIPPFDDFISYTQEEIASKNEDINIQLQEASAMPRDEFDSAIISDEVRNMVNATFDGISGIEKIQLIKEAGSIRANLQTVQSGMEKLKMVKRIKEIRDALGVKAESNADKQEKAAVEAATMADVNNAMPLLKKFIGAAQLSSVGSLIRSEEGQFFKDKLIEISQVIQSMPKTYGQDGMGDKAIVYFHYFKGSGNWYITEKDTEDDQMQAFGLADIFGDGGELGYINIEEIIQHGVELDFHWTPKTIGQIEGSDSEDETQNTEAGDDLREIQKSTEDPDVISSEDTIKSGFISELELLKTETDINRFNERLDEIAARIEQAGLMEVLDKELNDTADVFTALLSAAESGDK